MEEKIKDFESGAKSSGNLPPYECLTRDFLRRAAERMRLGMHYGKHNWKKGASDKAFILDRLNHALEHLTKAMEEIDNDVPYDDDDLAAVVVNCMFAMEYQKNRQAAEEMKQKQTKVDIFTSGKCEVSICCSPGKILIEDPTGRNWRVCENHIDWFK